MAGSFTMHEAIFYFLNNFKVAQRQDKENI